MFYSTVCFVCILSPLMNMARTSKALDDISCRTAAEAFVKRVGPDNIPVSLISDAILNECSGTLKHTDGATCCNADMESQFMLASADYLHEHIEMSNAKLKARITHSLNLYQEHLTFSLQEAYNKTSDTLDALYKIPKEIHKKSLDPFFDTLKRYLLGSNDFTIVDIINNYFINLFPAVFDYVLSDPSKPKKTDDSFHKCLRQHYNEIQPFGNAPTHLGRKIKFAFRRARMFTETLKVMINTIVSTDKVTVDKECRKAISRLHFCSLCSGEVEVKPCRGLCLNVMRGCLAGISEIASSWDELIVAFENIQLGMFKQNNAQELLSYLDGNVTDALLQAMDDGPRIYSKVMSLCQESQKSESDTPLFKKFVTPEGYQPSHPGSRIHSIRKDITSLIEQLEDSKGFFQRIADGLCRTQTIYDQEMQSDRCWNGSAVGRYMYAVPEANMISQAQQNLEVRITLIPDTNLLQVKDNLTHIRRELNILHNEELMLNDESYKKMVSSGGGYSTQDRDAVVGDDEDFTEGLSGSGSGDSSTVAGSETETGEKSTVTTRPAGNDSGKQILVSASPGTRGAGTSQPSDSGDKPNSTARSVSMSFTLLFICAMLLRIQTSL